MLYFSKAFDTVEHNTLMEKMAHLTLPDAIYNWINDFSKAIHTVPRSKESFQNLPISSVIRGSALSLPSFIVSASDLQLIYSGNALHICYRASSQLQHHYRCWYTTHVQKSTDKGNLKLNGLKSKEITFTARGAWGRPFTPLPPCLGMSQRVCPQR